ncbi:DUF1634 domain-containing protein [Acidianus manzaensis]|uniref:DUF1634 domain-containing protein n=1 Tax=Acidianus manzaensis TaxID=282676 RepID=A0A1W6JYB4_9CREN|nr:DUF1634 domain-containing protein [Acidianus manzaensis]ARM75232.1 hypothetical protein B6F84_03755 [Acidianus manzaensis]
MDFNNLIGNTLRVGVIISAIIILAGVIMLFVFHGSDGYTIVQISAPNSIVNSSISKPYKVFNGLSKFYGLDYIYLGLMVLIATPVIRVVLGIAQFISEKNKLYAIITTIVLFNLLFAIFLLPLIIGK